jgi:predicted DNA binding CopG/RHH family protein
MKFYELSQEEQQILDDIEQGDFNSIGNLQEEQKRFQQVAKESLGKTKNINIRVSEKALLKIKAKAAENGLPYQTLVSSVLHRFANK